MIINRKEASVYSSDILYYHSLRNVLFILLYQTFTQIVRASSAVHVIFVFTIALGK